MLHIKAVLTLMIVAWPLEVQPLSWGILMYNGVNLDVLLW